jgi:hypothetical protein
MIADVQQTRASTIEKHVLSQALQNPISAVNTNCRLQELS